MPPTRCRKITLDGTSPCHGNGEVVCDTFDNFAALFQLNDPLKRLRSTSWADYHGPAISVNQFCQKHRFDNRGVLVYSDLERKQ